MSLSHDIRQIFFLFSRQANFARRAATVFGKYMPQGHAHIPFNANTEWVCIVEASPREKITYMLIIARAKYQEAQ